MNKEFEIIIADDSDHEKVYAEIQFDGKFVALVSYEDGEDQLMLETPGVDLHEEAILRKVDLNSFLLAVEADKQKLLG